MSINNLKACCHMLMTEAVRHIGRKVRAEQRGATEIGYGLKQSYKV